jgi:hypothetical protein
METAIREKAAAKLGGFPSRASLNQCRHATSTCRARLSLGSATRPCIKDEPQGVVRIKWTAFNQHGEPVYTFTPIGAVPRRLSESSRTVL